MFPVIGSGVLFGLYILFKYFSKEYVNLLLTAYFLFFGILAVSSTVHPFFLWLFTGVSEKDEKTHKLKFSLPFRKRTF